jgi:DHA1 family tetracycline resistance protein-like MFS transporter
MAKSEDLTESTGTATNRSALMILFLTVFIDLLGFGIVIPFLPLFAEQLHVRAAGIGLLVAIYSLTQLIFAPILGSFSDRLGRRPIILLGLFGSAVGYTIYGLSISFAWLLLSRTVHGAFAGTVSTAQAYVADTTPPGRRTHAMGMIGAAFGLGFVLGPAIGGLLGHWGLRVPVFFAAALSLANLLFAAWRLPEPHLVQQRSLGDLARAITEPWRRLPAILANPALSSLFGDAFLLTSAFAILETTFALLAAQHFGYSATGIGGLLAFAGLIQALAQGYLVGKLAKRAGEFYLVIAGAVLTMLGMAPMGLTHSRGLLLVLLGVVSIGYGLASPAIASLITKRAPAPEQGQVLGVNQSALSLARIFGPLVGGALYQLTGGTGAYIGAALLGASVLLLSSATASPAVAGANAEG